jgi:hypothetical protein
MYEIKVLPLNYPGPLVYKIFYKLTSRHSRKKEKYTAYKSHIKAATRDLTIRRRGSPRKKKIGCWGIKAPPPLPPPASKKGRLKEPQGRYFPVYPDKQGSIFPSPL